MLSAITTKLELDVMQASELDQAFMAASQHTLPAIVVHPQLMAQAIVFRAKRRGRFKLIAPIDWPKGELFGMTKLRGITTEMLQADGFEIMLTGNKNEAEIRNEARIISAFLRNYVSKLAEIRFVLGCFTRSQDEIIRMCSVMKDIPAPALIRTDHHTKAQATKANAKAYIALLSAIRGVSAHPIKLSGNIDSVKIINSCLQPEGIVGAAKFAVTLQQLQAIIKELQKQNQTQTQTQTNQPNKLIGSTK